MFGWARKLFGRGKRVRAQREPERRARYDAAQTTDDNRNHWAAADALGARSANCPGVRKRLRERARYEVANNSYARGITLTLANDLIGTGPRLQVLTENREANRQIEKAFAEWARAIGLAEKLRTMKLAKSVDGEPFALLTTNDALPTAVKLDLRPFECDQVADPGFLPSTQANEIDGIRLDSAGNPSAYYVLREHPGDSFDLGMKGDWIAAKNVLHWFRADRAGQLRGIPEIVPGLPLLAELRRFTRAVVAAAETAADFAALMKSTAPAEGDDDDPEPMSTLDINKRMMTALPKGWDIFQLKAEQPATTYEMFVRLILREIARCLNVPLNVALGDSSGYNYSSGRLDHQTYFKSLLVERSHLEEIVLRRIFLAWLDEAIMVPGLLPAGVDIANLNYHWFWDGWEHVDPVKEAQADTVNLANNTTTLAEVCAAAGNDWEDILRQRAKELALMKELGIPMPAAAGSPPPDQNNQDQTNQEPALAA